VFTQATNVNQTTDGHQIFIYYGKNIKGGADTLTASWPGAASCNALHIFEFSGLDPANPLDKAIAATGSGTVANSGTAGATTQANELLLGFFGDSGAGTTVTTVSGYTRGMLAQYGGRNNSFSEYSIVSSVGAYSATSTSNASENFSAILAEFKAPAAPVISSFGANPGSISPGGASTLSWSTSGATSISISPGSYTTSSSSGSLAVDPAASTTYILTATNAYGSTTAQATVSVVSDTTPPSVPTNLAVTATTASTVSLSWSPSTDNVGVAGYRVFRNGTQVSTVSGTTFTDTGLTQSTTYAYTVAAFDAAGNVSAQCSAVQATTKSQDTTPPTVSITSPANNSTVSGTTVISGTSSDNVAVASVAISIDGGSYVSAQGTTAWSYSLNTASLSNASHTIAAKAADAAGNTTVASITVVVNNSGTSSSNVAFDAAGPGSVGASCAGCSGLNWNHTISGANGLLTVSVAVGANVDTNLSLSATYNGVAMASAAKVHSNQQSAGFVQLFYLAAPATGTHAVQVALSGGTAYLEGGSVSFTGVNQSAPIGSLATSYGYSTSPSVSVKSSTGDMVVDAVVNGSSINSSAQTLRWLKNQTGNTAGGNSAQSTAAGAGSVTMGYSAADDWWAIIGVDVVSANAGSASTGSSGSGAASPTVPANLAVTGTSSSSVSLSWSASTDSAGIAGYRVYRNGGMVGTTTQTAYTDTPLSPSTTYDYAVSAFDGNGNVSALSSPEVPATTSSSTPAGNAAFPLKQSTNKRYLVDQNNVPFLLVGDSPHTLFTNLSEASASQYFADRAAHGVNALWAEILVNTAVGGNASASTYDGIVPFTTQNDFATPNPAYFQRVDDMVNLAAQYGIVILMDALENDGWMSVVEANGSSVDFNYGVYLGNRYKSFPNIVWIIGNDFQTWNTSSTDNADAQAIIQGILSADPNHLLTTELNWNMSGSLDDSLLAPYTTVAGAYTYYPPYYEVENEYNASQTTPVYLEESYYEGISYGNLSPETASNLMLRKIAYESTLSGGIAGYMYGSVYYTFPSGWQSGIDSPGVADLSRWAAFFKGIAFYNLAPDQAHTFVTAGYGAPSGNNTGNIQTDAYVTAASSADGTLGTIYLPAGNSVNVNMGRFSGSVNVQWFDPTSGSYTTVSGSPFANSGSKSFSSPGSNSSGDPDWILLFKVN
jgi:chitodextrinase